MTNNDLERGVTQNSREDTGRVSTLELEWVINMRAAMKEFMRDVRQSLPDQPSGAEFERTCLLSEQLMRDLMQSVVDDHAPRSKQLQETAGASSLE